MKKLTSFLAAILSFVVCLGGVSPALAQELPQPASRGITTFYATPGQQAEGVKVYEGQLYDIAIPNPDLSKFLPENVSDFPAAYRPILENGRRQNGTNGSFTEGSFDFQASTAAIPGTNTKFEVKAPQNGRIYSVVAGLPASLCPLKINTTEVDFFDNVKGAETRAVELDAKGFFVYVSPKDDLTIKAFSKLFYDEATGKKKTNPQCFLVSGSTEKVQTDFRQIFPLLPLALQQPARQAPFQFSPKVEVDSFIYLVNARKTLTIQGGNAVINRPEADRASNFYLVDTNNPVNVTGSLTEWNIWAKNTLPVQLIIYRRNSDKLNGNQAPWSVVAKSNVQIPVVGQNSFKLPTPIQVLRGDFVGLYHEKEGSVAFTLNGPPNLGPGNFTGSVLQTRDRSGPNSATDFVFSSDRTYSVSVR
ncbi:MAG: hypothetical protein JGK21_27380 [Microcoleus sp. PH2017_22_RUC_O_B]|uniref:hypothetical protein n=1 Tax=unclassified Microcoleus TaxID=2642155 RepID=UPI001DDF0788|nr:MULTISPECIES: hypothetical protein [unclassified Microcoleus]MCC3531688.1 hypothetical protein [Microcoleus sp. PH2017_21_RUC_O_A]MCC3544007.1 hypothetical protein [Microcoleus sp. PH2017_22_RUC_O_B]